MSNAQLANRIGTMVRCNRVEAPDYIRQILPHGFDQGVKDSEQQLGSMVGTTEVRA